MRPRHTTLTTHITSIPKDRRNIRRGSELAGGASTLQAKRGKQRFHDPRLAPVVVHQKDARRPGEAFPDRVDSQPERTDQQHDTIRTNVHSSRTFSLSHGRASNPSFPRLHQPTPLRRQPTKIMIKRRRGATANRQSARKRKSASNPKGVANSRPRDANKMLTEESLPNG